MTKFLFSAALPALILLFGCAHGDHHKPDVKTGKLGNLKYHFRSKTYFAGQPDEASIKDIKDAGVTTVINLRTEEEMKSLPYDEKKAVTAAGMNYYHFPVTSDQEFSTDVFAKVEEVFMYHHKKGETILVHCRSGSRSAAWFAYHLKHTHGDSVDATMEQVDALGVSANKPLRDKIHRMLRE